MSDNSAIEWTHASWNPIIGCSRVSEGCRNCYAERQAIRIPTYWLNDVVKSTPAGPRWTGTLRLHSEALLLPLRWRRPRRIFVNSMSDLFHEHVPIAWIAKIFDVMAATKRHTFQVLTKRAKRMHHVMSKALPDYLSKPGPVQFPLLSLAVETTWPLPNVWLGVSVEDQATADARIPPLLQTPTALRWVSYEPALGPVNFDNYLDVLPLSPGVDWLVIGGESGPGARPFDLAWARAAIAQCHEVRVPVFMKQLGVDVIGKWDNMIGSDHIKFRNRKGSDPSEWPPDLRVRQSPAP